jgi:hypothetical protein
VAARVTVTYTGGESETIVIRPLGMVAAERKFAGGVSDGHSMEAMLWSAWYLKGQPDSFDSWLATIEDMDMEGKPPVPLAEEPSAGTSPT